MQWRRSGWNSGEDAWADPQGFVRGGVGADGVPFPSRERSEKKIEFFSLEMAFSKL